MGGNQPTPESSRASPEDSQPQQQQTQQPPPQPAPKRILACVLCQQRKIKCERRFPCSQCTRSGAECVPAAALGPRPRRPRFPEKALLDRLRAYEELLRHHKIEFEPMHGDPSASLPSSKKDTIKSKEKDDDGTEGDVLGKSGEGFLGCMKRGFQTSEGLPIEPPSDPVKQIATRLVWEGLYDNNDHHFFGLNKSSVGLSSLHPTPAEAFRLWQIYLDYVNPLLKITHTPTLQPRIVEAVGDFTNLEPPLEALLFGIYCMAIQALSTEESMSIFKSSRGELLSRFQLGCQHALVNCGYLRTTDRDSLTAHLLYLLSIGMAADPRAMSATLGLAVRTAQRMGLHSETALAKHPPFEVEMRRRLWWVLALYDTRIGELADYKNTGLSPTWDCKPPLNVNDSELWPDMKELPAVPADDHHRQSKPSEALFAVVRASMMDMVRRTSSYIGFYFSADPAFGGLANKLELSELQAMIEDRLLKGCDPENPEHCMATWMSRTGFARFHLMEHYARQGRSSLNPIEAQRDASISYALSYLENDTKMSGNMQLRRYDWYHRLHFPLPGYIHILYDLRMRPLGAHADRAWEVLGDNFDARSHVQDVPGKLRIRPLENLVFMAWEARIASLTRSSGGGSTESNPSLMPPRIVSYIQAARSSSSSSSLQGRGEQGSVAQNFDTSAGGGNSAGSDELDWGINTLPGMPFADSFPYGMDWQADFAAGLDVPGDTNVTQLNWATMGWGIGEN